jgi:hypothetical protein
MDPDTFNKLIERAKSDPKFFHALVFEPESVLGEIDLPRASKATLISRSPAESLARLAGVLSACGNTCTSSCDNTCGQSCGFTTNLTANIGDRVAVRNVSYFSRMSDQLAGCGNTCTSSCDNTCGQSCGFTTNFTDRFGMQQQFT